MIYLQQSPTYIDNIMTVFLRNWYNIMETTSTITDNEFCYLGILFTDQFFLVFLRTKRDNKDIFLSFKLYDGVIEGSGFATPSVRLHQLWEPHFHYVRNRSHWSHPVSTGKVNWKSVLLITTISVNPLRQWFSYLFGISQFDGNVKSSHLYV